MFKFFKRFRKWNREISRRREITRNVRDILKNYPEGLTASDVWKCLEVGTDDYKDPNYIPLAEVYSILVAMREKDILYNVSKMETDDGHLSVYWRLQ